MCAFVTLNKKITYLLTYYKLKFEHILLLILNRIRFTVN